MYAFLAFHMQSTLPSVPGPRPAIQYSLQSLCPNPRDFPAPFCPWLQRVRSGSLTTYPQQVFPAPLFSLE
ncbi:hypothetical protein RB213_007150 [Colletotrichum asianum]